MTNQINELIVSEIFSSWQGEGSWAGQYTTFIRLFGCDVGCDWCDTGYGKIDVPLSRVKVNIPELVARVPTDNITITGGEPMLFQSQLVELIKAFNPPANLPYPTIRMETSGICHETPSDLFKKVWITFSPKDYVSRKGTKLSLNWFWDNYSELKLVVDREPESIKDYLMDKKLGLKPLFFQPNYYNFEESLSWCKELTQYYKNARISLQTHKIINVR